MPAWKRGRGGLPRRCGGLGYGPDRFVGSLAWNTHRHLELFYAATGVGAALHTANPRLPPAQIAYTINFTGYQTLFIDADTLALAEQLAPQLQTVRRYVMMAPAGALPPTSLPELLSLRGPAGERRCRLRLAGAGRAVGVPAVLHLRHHRAAERGAVQPSRHGAERAVHRRRQWLGAERGRCDHRHPRLLPLQRLGGAVLRADVRRQAGAAGTARRQRLPARA